MSTPETLYIYIAPNLDIRTRAARVYNITRKERTYCYIRPVDRVYRVSLRRIFTEIFLFLLPDDDFSTKTNLRSPHSVRLQ